MKPDFYFIALPSPPYYPTPCPLGTGRKHHKEAVITVPFQTPKQVLIFNPEAT